VAALEDAAPSVAQAAPRLNRPFVATLMLSYLGANVALVAPIQNVLPRIIQSAVGPGDKALWLGLVTGIGALAALVVNPVAGHYSDRWVSADNRSVTVLIGLVAGGACLELLGQQHSVAGIAVWWTLCQAAINIAYSPMSAIVVDHVDRQRWGFVWGLISVAQAVGLIAGFAAVVLVFPSAGAGMTAVACVYVVLVAPLVLVLYRLPRVSYLPVGRSASPGAPPWTAWPVPPGGFLQGEAAEAGGSAASAPAGGTGVTAADERPGEGHPREATPVGFGGLPGEKTRKFRTGMSELLSAGQGFSLVWLGKFLILLAETIALLYLYYYLHDVVHYRDPGQGQLILVLIATAAVIVATVAVGRIADLSGGYRRYAVLASALMALTGFVLAGVSTWSVVTVCAFALGAGFGAFQSVSQALSIVVLPHPANAGRDLGIINIASAIPAVIGGPVAGVVVADAGGYRGLFVFAGILALAAAVVFARVPAQPGAAKVS